MRSLLALLTLTSLLAVGCVLVSPLRRIHTATVRALTEQICSRGPGATAAALGSPTQMKDAVAVSACDYYLCIVDSPARGSQDVTSPFDRRRSIRRWSDG